MNAEIRSLIQFHVGDHVRVESGRATAWDNYTGVVTIATPTAAWVRLDQSGTPVMFLPGELVMDE